MSARPASVPERDALVRRLRRERPRSRFVRGSAALSGALIVGAWVAGEFHVDDFLSERRLVNLQRFVAALVPQPLQGGEWDWTVAAAWVSSLMHAGGWMAVATTLAISIAAITLAGGAGLLVSFAAARTMATAEPYLPGARPVSRAVRALWAGLVWFVRAGLIFFRGIPEYVWTFLLIAVIGPSAWAAVLALAIHNAGILGKLNAEVIENLEAENAASLRALGASRSQVAFAAILPAAAPRFLLFLFYRWETCVREATVLGTLGIVSLGYFIQDARARQYYDTMFALILLGAALVLIGDLVSAAARAAVRRSG